MGNNYNFYINEIPPEPEPEPEPEPIPEPEEETSGTTYSYDVSIMDLLITLLVEQTIQH